MAKKQAKNLDKVRRLRQVRSTWLCSARRMRTWIDGDPPYRPFMVMVMEQERGTIRQSQLLEEAPVADQVLEVLIRAMNRPLFASGKRSRPTTVLLDNREFVDALAPRLAKLDIRCEYRASLPLVDTALRDFEAFSGAEDGPPALVQVAGMTQPLAAELYAAAAGYYQQPPWRWLSDAWPIEVCYPADAGPRYAVVMGYGGETYGLAVYDSLDDLDLLYSGMSPEQFAERSSWISVLFEPATSLSFDDLDAIEANGWPVAGENAYPLVLKFTPPETLSSPGLAEVAWLAAALRVLPDFVAKKMRPERGYPNSAEATYSLPDVHGNQQIALRFPAEDEEEEWDEEDWDEEDWELEDEDEDEDEDDEDDGEAELEEFIADWYWDEASHQFCREMGAFLFAFIDDLIENANLSGRTIQKHIDNCWAIGNLTASYGSYDTFSPKIFLSGPSYLYEFKRKYSGSKSAVSSYQATWRKLEKYARSLDYED